MDTSVVDELYGDLDQGHLDSVLNYDEDSVDIYSGLEDSPKKNKEHGKKDTTFLSPRRVKESLDLYEELVTQEREEKDATYNELKSKFAAAQNQVQDLLAKMQQMETKNSSLHHENTLLKKNLCALIKTAKMEIVRKDEEISKLSKRSSRGHFHSSAKESQHDACSRSSAGLNSLARPVGESRDLKRDKILAEVSQGRLLSDRPRDKSSVDSVKDPFIRQNKDSHSLDLLPGAATQDHKHTQGNRPSCSREKGSTSTDACDETDRGKSEKSTSREKDVSDKSRNKMDKSRSEGEKRGSSRSSCGSSNSQRQQQEEPVTAGRSGYSRSPSETSDTQSRKDESRHKQRQERQSRRTEVIGSRSEMSSSDKSHRSTGKQGSRDHHRKEERRQSSERRRTRNDGIKEYQHKKTVSEERNKPDEKNSNRGDQRSTRSETSKEHERQDPGTTKGLRNNTDKTHFKDGKDRSRADVRENRRHASPVKPHHGSQNPRKDQEDTRRTSGRTVESSRSKTSSGRDDSRGYTSTSFARHGVSKERSDKVKQSGTPAQGSKNAPEIAARTRIPKTSEDGNVQEDRLPSARRKPPTRLPPSCDSSGIQEEGSPKRKLSFMETLNLTVSPIKKQNSSKPQPQELKPQSPPEDTPANNSTENRSLFEVGEEFFVIDKEQLDSIDDSLALSTQPHDTDPPTSMEIKTKQLEVPKRSDQEGNLDKTPSGKVDGEDSEAREEKSIDGPSVLLTDISCKDSQASVRKDEESAKNCVEEDQNDDTREESIAQNNTSPQVTATSIMPSSPIAYTSNMDNSVCLEVVSSTIGVKNNRQCKETIVSSNLEITQSLENPNPCPDPLTGPSAEAVNMNATAQEKRIPEQASSSEPDSTENEMEISGSLWPTVVPHDEDSMMLTLSSIKVIPEVISPLTSPIRQIKKSQQQRFGKETHVKSLSKDFSTSAPVVEMDAVKMDMNKENKRPDSLVTPSVQKDQQEALSSTATVEDLEEGELVSESDGEGALVIQSPPTEKISSLRNQSSPGLPRLQKKSQTRPVTPSRKEQEKKAISSDSPSSNKRRFKTVTIPPKVKISTCAEFMNMLLFIRSELRRKYMKLHKNVTKPAFSCIIEMSQASFAEYVDGVNFDKFCSQGNNINPQLNKIIQSVMSKVSNNGIVNRIFEQRSDDLKQKLWNFVDGQFDFLFKELKAALKSSPDPSTNKSCLESKQRNSGAKQDLHVDVRKLQTKEPFSTTENRPHKITKGETEGQKVQEKIVPFHSLSCRGLGSSGKNIKATMEEGAKVPAPIPFPEKSLQEIVPAHENKTLNYARRLSHSGSTQDRADFEILTEQQTSSLTFNLVTDSQMGDIFRCLLQGSDLLETGDNQNWPLNTPRKEGQTGENLLGLITPSKMMTPSKLITTWTPISPYKFQIPLNPAVLDENCMLEVPSNAVPNPSVPAVATVSSQQPYSILAEDLSVSLTIPSPLKSDGHLSFLHPESGQPLTTPCNVISAHYSEDALLDGEDATEQDIHLSLETDNSSSPSSTSGNWDNFQFKPNLPMQAEVMERSNDHFIVRIRQTCPGPQVEPVGEHKGTLPNAEDSSSQTLDLSLPHGGGSQVTLKEGGEDNISAKNTSDVVFPEVSAATWLETAENQIEEAAAATESEHVGKKACQRVSRKRKMHHSGPKAKRSRREKSQDKQEKRRHKKKSKSSKEKEKTPSKRIKTPSPQLSPNSLSAKNVIRKKGEVVVTWTREEDRDILVTLKTKRASSKTFAALAAKLCKSQAQIEERFSQLMKLFKKKEKMEG